jgi:hypothetical protein
METPRSVPPRSPRQAPPAAGEGHLQLEAPETRRPISSWQAPRRARQHVSAVRCHSEEPCVSGHRSARPDVQVGYTRLHRRPRVRRVKADFIKRTDTPVNEDTDRRGRMEKPHAHASVSATACNSVTRMHRAFGTGRMPSARPSAAPVLATRGYTGVHVKAVSLFRGDPSILF